MLYFCTFVTVLLYSLYTGLLFVVLCICILVGDPVTQYPKTIRSKICEWLLCIESRGERLGVGLSHVLALWAMYG